MLHALGFHHEHNRPDRATFLDVDLDATDADAQFQLMGTSEWVRALTDTGEDSKLVHRRNRPKVDASIFDSALSHTRRSDASEKREENSVVALRSL